MALVQDVDDRGGRVAAVLDGFALDHAEWLEIAYEAAHRVATETRTLTTDDLWPLVTWPDAACGGRLMGQVVRRALRERWIAKVKISGAWRVIDYVDLAPVRTLDGHLVRHQTRVGVYRSLIFHGPTRTP